MDGMLGLGREGLGVDCLGDFMKFQGPILQVVWNCILRRWGMVVKG